MTIGRIVHGGIEHVIFSNAGKCLGSKQRLSIFASVAECVSAIACVFRKCERNFRFSSEDEFEYTDLYVQHG